MALSSCMGKFFSKILHNRLDKFLEVNKVINPEQIGFQKGSRTSDHILTLKTLIDKSFRSSKRLYACFVDLRKAFDTVNREALLFKLAKCGFNGNFYSILKDMYKEVKYAIKLDGGETPLFTSQVGVKQGCILNPSLFYLYE